MEIGRRHKLRVNAQKPFNNFLKMEYIFCLLPLSFSHDLTFDARLNCLVKWQIATIVLQMETGAHLAEQLQHAQLSLRRRAMGRRSDSFVLLGKLFYLFYSTM